MSSIPSTCVNKTSITNASTLSFAWSIGIIMAITILALASVGCSTTQEFKPTASVIVGGHKSI